MPSPPALYTLDLSLMFMIFRLLLPSDLKQLSVVSSALDTAVTAFWTHRLVAILSRHVDHPLRLLDVFTATHSVLSGSSVLELLLGTSWQSRDLDIYCPSATFYTMVYHLAIYQGYELVNAAAVELHQAIGQYDRTTGGQQGYDATTHFSCVARMRKGDLAIDVIQSSSSTALEPISAFWATHVQNFATSSMICMAYPSFTERRQSLLAPALLRDLQHPLEKILVLIAKYQARGFQFAVRPYALEDVPCRGDRSAACPSTVRTFFDNHSLIIYTQPIARRMSSPAADEELGAKQLRWWRGGVVCGAQCGTEGMRVWPGVLQGVEEGEV